VHLNHLAGKPQPKTVADHWALLRAYQLDLPQDWLKVPAPNWVGLLREHPELIDRLPAGTKLSSWDLLSLCDKHPQLAIPWRFEPLLGSAWKLLMEHHPELFEHVPRSTPMGAQDWVELLFVQPRIQPVPPHVWGDLRVSHWSSLLCRAPQLAVHCTCWDRFSRGEWTAMLTMQPQLPVPPGVLEQLPAHIRRHLRDRKLLPPEDAVNHGRA
jgi:hypothetical protein